MYKKQEEEFTIDKLYKILEELSIDKEEVTFEIGEEHEKEPED